MENELETKEMESKIDSKDAVVTPTVHSDEKLHSLNEGDLSSKEVKSCADAHIRDLKSTSFSRAKYEEQFASSLIKLVVMRGDLTLLRKITEILVNLVFGGDKE